MTKPIVTLRSFADSPESFDWREQERNASGSGVTACENRQQGPLKIVSALLIKVVKESGV